MVQLQKSLADFEAAGVTLVAISYDPPGTLADFATARGVTFPLLSDDGSRTIKSYGVHDPNGNGYPLPGTLLVDKAGIIRGRFFYQGYSSRVDPQAVLTAAKALK